MNVLSLKFSKDLQHKINDECYNNLNELPQFNWQEVNKGDYTFLFKKKRKYKEKEYEPLSLVYRSLMAEYIKDIGIDADYKEILLKRKEIAVLQCDYVTTGDEMFKTLLEIAEIELKELIDRKGQSNFNEVKAFIDKQMGFYIDLKKISVKEFDGIIKLIKKTAYNGKEN